VEELDRVFDVMMLQRDEIDVVDIAASAVDFPEPVTR